MQPVHDALLAPLRSRGTKGSVHHELAYAQALGALDAEARTAVVRKLLEDGDVLSALAAEVSRAAEELVGASAATAKELNSKFVADGGCFTMLFGDLSTFFSGLEGRVGTPHPALREAAYREHVESADSGEPFTTGNYNVVTQSNIEWFYVTDPESGMQRFGDGNEQDGYVYPQEQTSLEDNRRRTACGRPLSHFMPELQERNARLAALGEPRVTEDELIGARMYTGPCFVKYNGVLRGVNSPVPFLKEQFEKLCKGNLYTTTLHIINSCIVKLSKLTAAQRVYRGYSGCCHTNSGSQTTSTFGAAWSSRS